MRPLYHFVLLIPFLDFYFRLTLLYYQGEVFGDFVFEFRDGLCGRLDVSQIQELESSWTFSSSTSGFSVNRPQTVCSRAIRVLCMCMGLGDTDGQREIQVDVNKGEHEKRGKQRCMNRKSCQGRREYVHSRNSRGIKIHSGKMQKP